MQPFNLTVPMYHYVRDTEKTLFPKIYAISLSEFDRQLDYLQSNYNLISWPELRKFFQRAGRLPENPCLLTFDDGFKDAYTNVFPRLRKRGLHGLFFVINRPDGKVALAHLLQFLIAKLGEEEFRNLFLAELNDEEKKLFAEKEEQCLRDNPKAKFGDVKLRALKMVIQKYMPATAFLAVERLFERHVGSSEEFAKDLYLSDSETREMKKVGMSFGGHGTRHFWFTWETVEERDREIKGSAEMLAKIEEAPFIMSYPYGDYDSGNFVELRKYNFLAAVTINESIYQENQLALNRVDAFQLIDRLQKLE